MQETLIVIHHQNLTYFFEAGEQDPVSANATSVYGGPLCHNLSGCSFGPAPLQHIATLSPAQLPMLRHSLPLLYGFQYSGCELDYQHSASSVQLLDISPSQSNGDWPYENYPALLPLLPLRLTQTRSESWDDFSSHYPNLPAQQSAELVAIIPPPQHIGQSLWGEDGDVEEVCVVCECDLSRQQVRGYNICS